MLFKSLRVYQSRQPLPYSTAALQEAIEKKLFHGCRSLESSSAGFTPVLPTGELCLEHSDRKQWLVCLRVEEKLVPNDVVNRELSAKVEQTKKEEGRNVGRKERGNLREEIYIALLPRAFSRERNLMIWIDGNNSRICIDSTSSKYCELALNLLRECLGSLPVVPLCVESPASAVMTEWLTDEVPASIQLLDGCLLADPLDQKSSARLKGSAEESEIEQHIAAGKKAVELHINFNDQVSCKLTEILTLKGIVYSDEIHEELAEASPDCDPVISMRAGFLLMTDTLERLLDLVIRKMGGLSGQQEAALEECV